MRCVRFSPNVVLFAAALLFIGSHDVNAQGRPAKISVKPDKRTVQVGESFRIEVALIDAGNAQVSAPKDFEISLDILFPSGQTNKRTLVLRRGRSVASISLSLTEPGINRLRAAHPELREGGGSVMVRSSQQNTPRVGQRITRRPPAQSSTRTREVVVPAPPPPRPQGPSPPTTRIRGLIGQAGSETETAESVDTSETEPAVVDTAGDISTQPSLGALSTQPLSPTQEGGTAVLEFDFSPQRKLLADGRDGATISAFLTPSNGFDREVEVQLHNSDGTLEPRILRFPRGEWVADTILTSDRPGRVTVRAVRVNPPVEMKAPAELNLDFAPPIYESKISAGPREFTLLDQTIISVELFDHNGLPVITDDPREVHIALAQGSGHLDSTDLVIPPGRSNVSTTFTPTSWGGMVLSASTPGLATVETDPPLAVTFPFLVLGFSAFGGLLGGVVAFWVRKPSHWWRIIVGAITGLLLFGIIDLGLLAAFPAVAVANPLGAFVLAAIGGWMGTEVLDLGRKRLGLGSSKGGA